jgi:hypothetical protein
MNKIVVSCQPQTFKGLNGQPDVKMFKVFFVADDLSVGYVYSRREYKTGDSIKMQIGTNGDGRCVLKVVQ